MRAFQYAIVRFGLFLLIAGLSAPPLFSLFYYLKEHNAPRATTVIVALLILAYLLFLQLFTQKTAHHMAFEKRKLVSAMKFAIWDFRFWLGFIPWMGHWFIPRNEKWNDEPDIIAIDRDDYHAKFVGRAADGTQFFLLTLSMPGRAGHQFVAVYVFDAKGYFREARIDDLGAGAKLDEERAQTVLQQRLAELGPVSYSRIAVRPFQIQRFGTTFGLVSRPPANGNEGWCVEVQPGNHMSFHAPWDSGEYDT